MGRALEDTGLSMLKVTATIAATRVHSGLQSANLAVAIQLNNGTNYIDRLLMSILGYIIEHFSCFFVQVSCSSFLAETISESVGNF